MCWSESIKLCTECVTFELWNLLKMLDFIYLSVMACACPCHDGAQIAVTVYIGYPESVIHGHPRIGKLTLKIVKFRFRYWTYRVRSVWGGMGCGVGLNIRLFSCIYLSCFLTDIQTGQKLYACTDSTNTFVRAGRGVQESVLIACRMNLSSTDTQE